MSKKKTTDEFIVEAVNKHGNKYDYSKVNYVDAKTKVCIICPEHGEFWQKPIKHICGHGCPECNPKKKIPTNDVLDRFVAIHGIKYDYSNVKYANMSTKVCIICPEHGEFWQPPHNHLKGYGCPMCGKIRQDKKKTITLNEWVKRANEIHNNKYDYSKVVYNGCYDKVCVICPKHGEFWQEANSHLRGRGCPKCRTSFLETTVVRFLRIHNIDYVYQYFPKFLNNGTGHQSLDFYLPEYNVAIECQGLQHYKPVKVFGGEEQFKKQIELDTRKRKLCEDNGVKLLYYSTKEDIDKKTFSSLKKLLYEIKH